MEYFEGLSTERGGWGGDEVEECGRGELIHRSACLRAGKRNAERRGKGCSSETAFCQRLRRSISLRLLSAPPWHDFSLALVTDLNYRRSFHSGRCIMYDPSRTNPQWLKSHLAAANRHLCLPTSDAFRPRTRSMMGNIYAILEMDWLSLLEFFSSSTFQSR